jgi:hypothetical protein
MIGLVEFSNFGSASEHLYRVSPSYEMIIEMNKFGAILI